jgi:aspartyl protease family protein
MDAFRGDPDTLARLAYLVLLLVFVAGFFLIGQRHRLGRSLRDLVIWLLIFAMVVIAYGFRDVLRDELLPAAMVDGPDGSLELRRGSDGHFRAEVRVNGQPVRFMVDTGASDIVLSRADAERVGIDLSDLSFIGRARTANGTVAIAPVRLGLVEFGGFTDTGVAASVGGGDLDISLLGMAYLDRFASIEIVGDRMRLRR